jgi:predicted nucleotidyltransferase
VIQAREGDFLETVESLIFDVKGVCNPPDRIISFVRYVPDSKGERQKEGKIYRKIYNLKERYQFLREFFPHYIYFDPIFQRELQGVPLKNIRKMYDPVQRLLQLLNAERDTTEECAFQLVNILDIPMKRMGISGSILVGLHTENSDIDVMVYGEEFCFEAYNHLRTLREKGVLQQFSTERAKEKAEFRWGHSNEFLAKLEQKKVMHGLFQEREYFFRFLKGEYMRYGDVQYIPLHKAILKARIRDDTQSIFTPCCYTIGHSSIEGISKLVSLRGRFCEQAKKGDTIIARGTVEKVVTKDEEYHQLVMGDFGDYLQPE